MGRVIGIDLGTTNSCISVLETNKPVVIPNQEGSRTTPSVVAFTQNNERCVGQIAKRQALTNSQRTIYAVKRLIGRKADDSYVLKSQKILPYQICTAENGDAWVSIDGKAISPSEISSMILLKMKQIAEDYLGESVEAAVITVPAYFNDAQRQATKDAGRIAGLNVLRIFNEPTAAALAYGMNKHSGEKIAVFDLGGGTFDISILELSEGVYQVKSTHGDTFLGGEDFDQRIVAYLLQQFKENEGLDLSEDPLALQRMKESAEKAKHELSSCLETEIELPFIASKNGEPKHIKLKFTRTKLHELCQDLLSNLEEPCKIALADAKLNPQEIDKILLVGGMTRMPVVQDMVKRIFGKSGDSSINPDEVVAIGAGIQGGILSGHVSDVLLLDVTPLSLGIETAGEVFTKIIEKNTSIPITKSKIFTTAQDNQSFVSVHVLQGERELAQYNKTLAKFDLTDIPPASRGVPQIEVTFSIDSNGIVHVKAQDLGTKKEQNIRITVSSGLSEMEIQRMIKEAKAHAKSDIKQKEIVQARIELEGFIFMAEKSLKELEINLPKELVEKAQRAIEKAQKAMMSSELDVVQKTKTELNEAVHAMARHIYKNSAQS